ncbi:HAD family hydrolase [Flagellimonas sp.]|uniref:HAD family hydrolase n=1 Tax=Flagellimonas sp. TaxID=2058762 RepID=UPI003B50D137
MDTFVCVNNLYMVKRIVVFDFDGTITKEDSLFGFLKFVFGFQFYLKLISISHNLLGFKLGLINNHQAKQILFSHFFRGWNIDDFNIICRNYIKQIKVRDKAMATIRGHLSSGDYVLIISASFENLIKPWASMNNIRTVLGTRIEVEDKKITGNFLGKNCYGIEKVYRLLKLFPEKTNFYLIAYGDSEGDKELLEYANEAYKKLF